MLLVIHEHQDYFYPQRPVWRGAPVTAQGLRNFDAPSRNIAPHLDYMGGRMSWVSFLWIFGSVSVYEALAAHSRIRMDTLEDYRMSFTKICAGERFEPLPGLLVTLVLSCYGTQGNTFNYILERGEKTLLYALDSGGWDEPMKDIIPALPLWTRSLWRAPLTITRVILTTI